MRNTERRSTAKDFYMKFYVQDFESDLNLRDCSAVANGVYIRLLCLLFKCEPKGKMRIKSENQEQLEQFLTENASLLDNLLKQNDKQMFKQNVKQIKNICLHFASYLIKHIPYKLADIENGLFELLENDVIFLAGNFICQKRMLRDYELSLKRSSAGKAGGKKSQSGRKKENNGSDLVDNLLKQNDKQIGEQNPNYNYNYNYNYNLEEDKGVSNNTRGGKGDENSGGKEEDGEKLIFENVAKPEPKNTEQENAVKFTLLDIQLLEQVKATPEFAAAWQRWLNHAAESKLKFYKSRQSKDFCMNGILSLAGMDQKKAVEYIDHSIKNDFAEVFAPRNQKPEHSDAPKASKIPGINSSVEEQEAYYGKRIRNT